MGRQEELDEMRRAMGTLPNDDTDIFTVYHKGVSNIEVEIVNDEDYNPYKLIFEAAVATWGDEFYESKWYETTPENRFKVVLAALTGQTLPQALEAASFTFIVRGASRSAYDQHARQRFATFYSQGVRDNSRIDAGFRFPTELYDDSDLHDDIVKYVEQYKILYKRILEKGKGSYQSARCIMPMGMTHNYKFSANLLALKSYMAQRLKACEQADTCATAIAVRYQIDKRYPLIGSVMVPGCDMSKRCQYHKSYTLSEMFGCLFRGCGRWPDDDYEYATFNNSCSDYDTIENELGYTLPKPEDITVPQTYDELSLRDKRFFR